jgi:HAD superfamily hydrolase (TIGR01490 family)
MGKRIAFFDFDGTLTRNDTFMDFHLTRFGRVRVAASMLSACLRGFVRANLTRTAIKESFIGNLWTGTRYEDYLSAAKKYADFCVEKNLLPRAKRVFTKHLDSGDDVWIVTASMKDWVAFWAERYGVPVIGSELEVSKGFLTGKLATPNCRGTEKVTRIRAEIDLGSYSKIYAYGNSGGDRAMLDIADEAIYKWNREAEI